MKKILIAAATLALLTGCSSIINDKNQQVNVSTSNGTSVKGTVNGTPFTAPGIVALPRENKSKVFTTDNPNCAQETVAEKTVDPIFFINLLAGGPIGSSVDYGTEKMWKYADNITITCK
jgi:uncharacterized protein YceK